MVHVYQTALVLKPTENSHSAEKVSRFNKVEPISSSVKYVAEILSFIVSCYKKSFTFYFVRMLDMNQPMSEEESREWQERCDAVGPNNLSEKNVVKFYKYRFVGNGTKIATRGRRRI